ncbi:ARM repeat superfamily protein [Actinidia rufa]|uniref:ARM repeat superfamily protein n=1 Tax=Actinidia rufa TaxID=165716 RepID=A0A7J0GZC7_9ERIC|nr:ARM repeat superfamily protein [Actinidia rufa]
MTGRKIGPTYYPLLLKLISDQTNMNGVKRKSADSIVLSLSKTWQLLITLQQLPQATEIKLNESEIHLGLSDLDSENDLHNEEEKTEDVEPDLNLLFEWEAAIVPRGWGLRKGLLFFARGFKMLGSSLRDLDDMVVPTLVPVLFPCLHTIVSSPQTETSALISPMVPTWMDQFSIILEQPVQSGDPDDWSIRMEVLKCLNQFVQNFPNLAETQFMIVVRPLWRTFVSSLRVYEQSSIEGTEDPYEGRYDSDGAEQSLESFVIQRSSLSRSRYSIDKICLERDKLKKQECRRVNWGGSGGQIALWKGEPTFSPSLIAPTLRLCLDARNLKGMGESDSLESNAW